MTIVTREPASITTSFGATITVYVDVYRDADTGAVVAADAKVRDAHGNPLPTATTYLRQQGGIVCNDQREPNGGEVFIL